MKRGGLEWLTARPIAHRGYHDLAQARPENSLAAFEAAVAAGYAIECDLHVAADGVPIVFHDGSLERLTGASGCVRDVSSSGLKALRLAGTGESIPTLSDLLSLVRGRVPLVLELKQMAGRDAGFALAVVQNLQSYVGPVALMSFDPSLLADLRRAGARHACGLTALGDWRIAPAHLRTMLGLKLEFMSYSIDDLPTPLPIAFRRILGGPLICWTVRTDQQRAKAKVCTDQITFEGFAA